MTEHAGAHTISLPGGKEPVVADDVYRAPGSVLIGAVRAAPGSSFWFTSVVRADSDSVSIGARSNVQDGVAIHVDAGFPVVVGEDVSIGHNAVVHGASIGDRSLIGMGAVVLNGARIGADCLVAAGAVVLEGTEVPAGSLVAGVPARVRRALTDDEIAGLRANARGYVERARLYRASASESPGSR